MITEERNCEPASVRQRSLFAEIDKKPLLAIEAD
jgi:hypothetical protein